MGVKVKNFIALVILVALVVACSDEIFVPVNSPPTIESLKADSTIIAVNSVISIQCTATDPDNDDLSFEWISAPGTIQGEGATVCFLAPEVGAQFAVVCRVSDQNNNSAQSKVTINVIGNESLIYQKVIDYFSRDDWKLFIVDTTYSDMDVFPEDFPNSTPFEQLNGLDQITFKNYRMENQKPGSLHDYPFWNSEHELLKNKEFFSIFGHEMKWPASCSGWDKLDILYSVNTWTNRLLFLSKPGFNLQKNQALLFVSEVYRFYDFGYFIILKKEKEWEVEKGIRIWHSDFHCAE